MIDTSITDRQFEIIAAAGKILSQNGVGGLTIKNLAKEMGFSEGAVYRHFKSKEAIIVALLTFLSKNMDERLGRAITAEQVAEKQLMELFNNQFSFFSQHPYFVVAVFSDGLMEESNKINETILQIMQVKMKHLAPIVKRGQQENIFNTSISSEQMVHIIIGTFRLQMFKWRAANFQFDIKSEGEKIMAATIALIKA